MPGGAAQYLSNLIISKLGIKSRSEKPGLLGRCSISLQSEIDRKEAWDVGTFAVKSAIEGMTGKMVAIRRICGDSYACTYELVPLEDVANVEKTFPREWINERGNGIRKEFVDYCMPLIGEPLPEYITLDKIPVKKR